MAEIRNARRKASALALRQTRLAARIEIDGRPVVVDPTVSHGSVSTYNNWGCRCKDCTVASSEYDRRRNPRNEDENDIKLDPNEWTQIRHNGVMKFVRKTN